VIIFFLKKEEDLGNKTKLKKEEKRNSITCSNIVYVLGLYTLFLFVDESNE